MKRKLIALLTLCVVTCASIFGLSACNEILNAPVHSHVYNNKVTTETYLASDATCLQKAKYYFSCECGDVGSVTFEHGNYAPHIFENYTANNDAKCGVNGTETAACEQNGCSKTDTREIVGSALEHDFKTYVFDNNADCGKDGTETAVCERNGCNKTHTRTAVGTALEHDWSAWCSNGNNTHTRTCLHNSAHTQTKDCNGGTATCTEKAICVDCKESHGGFEKHNYIEQNTDSKYLKKEKECGAKAQYYYSCACGATGTNYFEHGTALEHEWSAWCSNGNNTHTRTCLHNSAHTETKDCNGGEPTTLEQATCADCGGKYGHTGLHTYSNEYSFSGTHHWLDATCGCDLQKDYAEHILGDDGYCSVCAAPVTDTAGIMYDTSADGTYAEVIGYEGTAKKIRIADTYNNLPVKSIYNSAFKNSKITSVIIPDSVTSIDSYAFAYCDSLTSVTIPDSVTSIGSATFYECDSLTSVTIGDSVTYIGPWAFYYCRSLTSVTIPDSVTSIGDGAFRDCTSLTSVTIGDSVTSIGERAFEDCKYTTVDNLNYIGDANNPYAILVSVANENLSTYIINENTKYICAKTFSDCARLSSIVIPDSVTSIGEDAFYECNSLTSIVIPNSVISIGDFAFYDCSSLTSVTIGDNVTSIGEYAFFGCDSLTSATIGNSVTSIGEYAFAYCYSLTSIVIPDSVTSIGEYAFHNCSSLETISCRAKSKPSGWDADWKYGCYAKVVWGYKG